MDQHGKGESWQQTKTLFTNIKKPTYLTTYEQFIANLIPKPYTVENTSNLQQKSVSQDTETKQTYVLQNIETNKSTLSSPKGVSPPSDLKMANNIKTNGASHILQSILEKPCPTSDTSKKLRITSNHLLREKSSDPYSASLQSKTSPSPESISNGSTSHRKSSDCATNSHIISTPIEVPPETGNTSVEQSIAIPDEEPMKAYECKICSFETIYESSFREHLLTHRKTKKVTFHKCPKCPFKIRCKASVRKHMVVHKKSPNDIEYCGLYAYSSKCKVNLDLHLHEHSSMS